MSTSNKTVADVCLFFIQQHQVESASVSRWQQWAKFFQWEQICRQELSRTKGERSGHRWPDWAASTIFRSKPTTGIKNKSLWVWTSSAALIGLTYFRSVEQLHFAVRVPTFREDGVCRYCGNCHNPFVTSQRPSFQSCETCAYLLKSEASKRSRRRMDLHEFLFTGCSATSCSGRMLVENSAKRWLILKVLTI